MKLQLNRSSALFTQTFVKHLVFFSFLCKYYKRKKKVVKRRRRRRRRRSVITITRWAGGALGAK
jgi:hypothetical protein